MRILVTGASGGLGSAVIHQFVKNGNTVFGVARTWGKSRDTFTKLQGDLTHPEECERIAAEAGDVDALIHLMGGFAPGGDNQTWQDMISVNLLSAAYVFNAALPRMRARGRGALVAVGSRAALEPAAGLSAYGASKAALVHYIRTLSLESTGSGVRVNIVLPSTIDTKANRKAMPDADRSTWVAPASIAKVVSWLVSTEACDVSGAVLPVYGRA